MAITRREFLHRLQVLTAAAATVPLARIASSGTPENGIRVSIVRRRDGDTARAVKEAVDLLGGIESVTEGKNSIMLKPNLVNNAATDTTDPAVVRALAELLIGAGKEVSIGEGSASCPGFNFIDGETYRAHDANLLDRMQQLIFDELGYTRLAEDLNIPLVNLHTGELVAVTVPDAYVFETLMLHRSLTEIDLLVSMPRMKTHTLATVTLGLKNMIGLYAGTEYGTVRAYVHDLGADYADVGTAIEIVDMARANKLGLTVIDGLVAMEGNGPSLGPSSRLVDMDLIIAGTHPLAADMVAASVMGFAVSDVPTFEWAIRAGMSPARLEDIDVRGESIEAVQRTFQKPDVYPWKELTEVWGYKDLT
ncbi:MAG TPA: DUF362 domain-containing protein [Aggregatilinea sp.]|jgi:uncharacterized protein (DUF362 family)|uniref:DUF362 domain-containing protein n=1 Tax=Aggregatilinea sp. TaxID=2806333 RepID=UPI002CBDC4C0|nr:DUF362 domain-containing protein [Aggregatilinea sp.]HML23386.1 DUF362 domain-containing protein [Aggregatilinea sp.]